MTESYIAFAGNRGHELVHR